MKHLGAVGIRLVGLWFVMAMLVGCMAIRAGSPTQSTRQDLRPAKEVALFEGERDRPVKELAVVDSFRAKKLDEKTVEHMMRDLQAKAQAVGADAVIQVRRLRTNHEGFVSNPRTPFPSVMQGKWNEYFFRGTAVKYTR